MKRSVALILILAIVLTALTGCDALSNLFGFEVIDPNENRNETVKNPPVFNDFANYKINSLDKVNYYSAIYVLSATPMPVSSDDKQFYFLNAYGADEREETEPDQNYDSSENTGADNGSDSSENNGQENNIYYYELSPDDVFSFDKVSMFQIELTDEDGFLASKLGLGTVDVVITENCIWGDGLITFRNGEKFYSCLSDGYRFDPQSREYGWQFSTHKFVDGFYIIKNLEQENYSFRIKTDSNGTVTDFVCGESERGGDRVDQNVEIVSSTVISSGGGRFTVSELEAYFKKGEE